MKQNQNKKSTIWKSIIETVIALALISAILLYTALSEEPKSDPVSEQLLRKASAAQLDKNVDELTNEDFAKITELYLDKRESVTISQLNVKASKFTNSGIIDLKFLEKFTNLKKLRLLPISYVRDDLPKWMILLAKCHILNIEEKSHLDLGPLRKLSKLEEFDTMNAQVINIKPLAKLKNMRVLRLDGTKISETSK